MPMIKKRLRAAIYTRYSSKLQDKRSIDRQTDDLEKAAQRMDLSLEKRHHFSDPEETATLLVNRPGLHRHLLEAARRREFDVVLVEHTDRLTRVQKDLFWLADVLKMHKVQIYTAAGPVSRIQLTFEGYLSEDFIEKLRYRIKSGHDLATRDGRFVGKLAYGYEYVPNQPGVIRINPEQAAVVIFIFVSYANGMSPRQIVKALAERNIPSPSGAPIWSYQTIVGADGAASGQGLLHHQLYVGKLVRNRTKRVKTERDKYVHELSDEEPIVVDVPALRIVSDEQWRAAHAVRLRRKAQMAGGRKQRAFIPRKAHLLAGLIRCAICNGQMAIIGGSMNSAIGPVVACSNATNRLSCDHVKTYRLNKITDEVTKKIHTEFRDPEFMKRRMKARALELANGERERDEERRKLQNAYDRKSLQVKRLSSAVALTDTPVEEIMEELRTADMERRAFKQRLDLLGAENNVRTLHSSVVTARGRDIDRLVRLLRDNPEDPDCKLALGNLFEGILVHPTPKKRPYDLSVMGFDDDSGLFQAPRTHHEIIEAEGFSPKFGSDSADTLLLSQPNNRRQVILLCRWQTAA